MNFWLRFFFKLLYIEHLLSLWRLSWFSLYLHLYFCYSSYNLVKSLYEYVQIYIKLYLMSNCPRKQLIVFAFKSTYINLTPWILTYSVLTLWVKVPFLIEEKNIITCACPYIYLYIYVYLCLGGIRHPCNAYFRRTAQVTPIDEEYILRM